MISFCIPRVYKHCTTDFIHDKLYSLHLGTINRITEFPCKKDGNYKKIFIHYSDFEENKQLYYQLSKRGYINVVYDNPWYWKLYKAYYQVPS